MKYCITPTTIASLALLATPSFAADELQRPNYKYAELDYVYATAEPDSPDLTPKQNNDDYYLPDGIQASGSWVFIDELLVRGSYYTSSGKYKSTYDVDASTWLISAGWLPPTDDTTALDVSLDYRGDNFDVDAKPKKLDESISGLGVSFGVRTLPFAESDSLLKGLEFGVRLGWYEGDYDGAIGYTVNAAYNINEHWGVNLYYDALQAESMNAPLTTYDLYKWGLGGRYYF